MSSRQGGFAKVGYLTKMGGRIKNWRKRIFALDLDRHRLFYFNSAEHLDQFKQGDAQAATGCINLSEAQVLLADYIPEHRWVMELGLPHRYYYISGISDDECREWMDAMGYGGATIRTPRALPAANYKWTLGKHGWLKLKTALAWKRRLVRAHQTRAKALVLQYFDDLHNPKPREVVTVSSVGYDARKAPTEVSVMSMTMKAYVFKAGSPKEAQEWARFLQSVTSRLFGEGAGRARAGGAASGGATDVGGVDAVAMFDNAQQQQQQQQQHLQQPQGMRRRDTISLEDAERQQAMGSGLREASHGWARALSLNPQYPDVEILHDSITFGRHLPSQVILNHQAISGQHCRLWRERAAQASGGDSGGSSSSTSSKQKGGYSEVGSSGGIGQAADGSAGDEWTVWLQDTSTNGTFIDGTRMSKARPVQIRSGTQFTLLPKTANMEAISFVLFVKGKALKDPLQAAPEGEVTFVFTDIQNSTNLWAAAPGAMNAALELHDSLFRELLVVHNGYEVKTEGDAFMVAFFNPLDAVRWCVAVQLRLLQTPWPAELLSLDKANTEPQPAEGSGGGPLWAGLRVRMGVHTGRPNCRRNPVTSRMDYFGPCVNLCARVSDAGHGGQVLCTREVRDVLKRARKKSKKEGTVERPGQLPSKDGMPDVSIKDLGEKSFKGVPQPVQVYQVAPASLKAREFPPLRLHTPATQTDPTTSSGAAVATAGGPSKPAPAPDLLDVSVLKTPTRLSPPGRRRRHWSDFEDDAATWLAGVQDGGTAAAAGGQQQQLQQSQQPQEQQLQLQQLQQQQQQQQLQPSRMALQPDMWGGSAAVMSRTGTLPVNFTQSSQYRQAMQQPQQQPQQTQQQQRQQQQQQAWPPPSHSRRRARAQYATLPAGFVPSSAAAADELWPGMEGLSVSGQRQQPQQQRQQQTNWGSLSASASAAASPALAPRAPAALSAGAVDDWGGMFDVFGAAAAAAAAAEPVAKEKQQPHQQETRQARAATTDTFPSSDARKKKSKAKGKRSSLPPQVGPSGNGAAASVSSSRFALDNPFKPADGAIVGRRRR